MSQVEIHQKITPDTQSNAGQHTPPSKKDVLINASSFGKFLANLRNEKGMSQRKLAETSELKNSTISRLEADAVSPDPSTLEKLAKALGTDKTLLYIKCGYIPKEFEAIAKRTGGLNEEQKTKVYDFFIKTIDKFLESIGADKRTDSHHINKRR